MILKFYNFELLWFSSFMNPRRFTSRESRPVNFHPTWTFFFYPRSEINQLLSKDPIISGHETHDIMFVDISQAAIGKDEFSVDDEELHRDRWITVREPSGELRLARWDERDIGLGVFYMEQREEFDSNRKIRPCPPSLMVNHTSFGDALSNGHHRQIQGRENWFLEITNSRFLIFLGYFLSLFYSKEASFSLT